MEIAAHTRICTHCAWKISDEYEVTPMATALAPLFCCLRDEIFALNNHGRRKKDCEGHKMINAAYILSENVKDITLKLMYSYLYQPNFVGYASELNTSAKCLRNWGPTKDLGDRDNMGDAAAT